MPEIISSELLIGQTERDEKGTKVEPEQQPVAHKMVIGDAMVTHGEQATGKAFNTSVIAEGMTAGEVSQNLATNCRFCAHYDTQVMLKIVQAMQWGSKEERETLQQMRGAVLSYTGDEDTDDVHAVDAIIVTSFGVCRAISEIKGQKNLSDLTYMHRLCGCPSEKGPKGEDLSKLFKLKVPAKKAAGRVKDDVLFTAQNGHKK